MDGTIESITMGLFFLAHFYLVCPENMVTSGLSHEVTNFLRAISAKRIYDAILWAHKTVYIVTFSVCVRLAVSIPLRAYYQLKAEIDEMREKQESLRSQRDVSTHFCLARS